MTGMTAERDHQGPDRQRMLDVVGLAARLGVTERFVRRLVHERRIPFYKVGALLRFDVADVEQWLATHRVVPTHPHRGR
jgi:excisionase family DNA binding protein